MRMRTFSSSRNKPSPGFTLMEIIIVSALLVVITGGLLTAFITGQTSYFAADASIQVQEEARKAFDSMVRELREAAGGQIQVSNDAKGNSQLDFQVALGYNQTQGGCTADNTVCIGARDKTGALHSGWFIRYRITVTAERTSLERVVLDNNKNAVAGETARVLANRINAAGTRFVWDPNNRIVTINLQSRITNSFLPSGSMGSGPLTTQVKLRNA